jgi:cobyrinic acid a,c-diamide synthase
MTRTAAALVLGCQRLDPAVPIAAVVLNQVAGARHERILREAIQAECRVPVLGAIPRVPADVLLPSRHLGLVTPQEQPDCELLAERLREIVGGHLDFDGLLGISRQAAPLAISSAPLADPPNGSGLEIGFFDDSAFCFYYPENLQALRAAGAALVAISSLTAAQLPPGLDALYIGGGFPETESPQGHGYVELLVDRPNPFFPLGAQLRGHEFHYSRIVPQAAPPATACAVVRGAGCGQARDAAVTDNVWAAYTHLHALATPEWAGAMIRAARAHVGRDDILRAGCLPAQLTG